MKVSALIGSIAFATAAMGNSGIYRLDFGVLRGNNKRDLSLFDEAPAVVKRDGSAELELQNKQTFYLANLKVGSNKDEVGVLVDTGSSDLWMMSHDLTCEAESSSSSSSSKRDVIVRPGKEKSEEETEKGVENNVKEQADVSKTTGETSTKTADVNQKAWGFGDMSAFTTIFVTGSPDSPGSGGSTGSSKRTKTAGGKTTNTCTSYGSFNTGNSDSFSRNGSAPAFGISYADGTTAYGIWGTDDVSIGDVTVKDLSFAVANDTTSNVGVLGIGLPGLETTYSSNRVSSPYMYENLPFKLKSQGTIEKAAYSVYLGEKNSKTGSILFGAVDSAKYTGDLKTVQIVNTLKGYYDNPIKLEIIVSGIKFNDSGSDIDITSNEYTAVLDTGSTYSYFPRSLLTKAGETLGGLYSSSLGAYIVECVDSDSYYFTINFSGAEITVPLSSLVTQYDTDKCFLSILEQTGDDYILFGDNVLRSAYLVYDLDDYEISLAQVKYTSDESISVISSSVPNAQKASGYSSTALPSSANEQDASQTATFGSNSNSGSKSSSASTSQLTTSKLYTLAFGMCLLIALSL